MMDIDSKNWTPKVITAWSEVGDIARSKGHSITNIYHLFHSLWNNSNSSFTTFLENSGFSLSPKRVGEIVDKFAKKRPELFFDKNNLKFIDRSIKNCIKQASAFGAKHGNVYLGIEHFIWSIMRVDEAFCETLLENGIDTEHLKLCIDSFVNGEREESNEDDFDFEGIDGDENDLNESQSLEKSQLSRFCVLLNEVACKANFGVISGRDVEIQRLEEILCCKTKSNCILIGEAGTGKTSVVEGLAQTISSKQYSGPLKNKKIYSLDVGLLIAGSKYRGQFEQRFTQVLEELKADPDAIVFIDEIHTIVGAGGREGSPDLANLLKPALARGEIKCIGATTSTEFKKYFEKDAALSRRFHHVIVEEPDGSQMKKIARKAIRSYEKYHEIKFPVKTIDSCIEFCETYLPHKRFIDKAFDVIDRSFAKAKMRGSHIVELSDVVPVVSELSGVNEELLHRNLTRQFADISDSFKECIFGQNEALDKIYDSLACAKAGLSPKDKPLCSFLFVGPTSVGKTFAAKRISEEFYGNNKSFLQLNMSEYQEPSSISRLIGASAGYVGYEDGGLLTEFVRKNPNSLILFDEVEKCNPTILNLLLQILDEAQIKDNLNREINFSRCIVVMTSNMGASEASRNAIGFSAAESSKSNVYGEAVVKTLSPELVSRIDEIITFDKLNSHSIARIFDQQVADLTESIQKKGIKINLKISLNDLEKTVSHLHAREIKSIFRKKVQTPLAHFLNKNPHRKKISAKVLDGRVVLN